MRISDWSSDVCSSDLADAFVPIGQRAQDKDRRTIAGTPERFDDPQPVDAAGQHAVKDHRVVAFGGCHEQAIAAVIGMVDDMAALRQSLADELADLRIVLDQKNLHRHPQQEPAAVLPPRRSQRSEDNTSDPQPLTLPSY